MKKHMKLLSALLCIFLCTSVLLSACLILHNTGHECIGENCQICQAIALQRELLKSILLCCLCGGIIIAASQLTVLVFLLVGEAKRNLNLVANKVKLTA